MVSLDVLGQGFRTGRYLSFCPKAQSFIPLRANKRCFLNFTNSKEVERERRATEIAFEKLKTTAPNVVNEYRELKILYKGLFVRLKSVRNVRYGVVGWILSRVRSKKLNKELRLLEINLNRLVRILQKNDQVSKALFSQIESAKPAMRDQLLFTQITKEMPDLITSSTPKSSDFGLTKLTRTPSKPFLLQKFSKEKSCYYKIFFPPLSVSGSPESISFRQLQNLPLIFRAYRKQKLYESCAQMSCQDKELSSLSTPQEKADKVHLKLHYNVNKPLLSSYTIVGSYYNPATGHVESSKLVLKTTHSLQNVQDWIQTLIQTNLERLETIKSLSEEVYEAGITPDFSQTCWKATASGDTMIEAGLNAEALQRLQSRIANRKANASFFKSHCRDENDTYFIQQIGSRAYEVHKDGVNYRILFSRLNADIDPALPVSSIDRSDCQEVCIVTDDQELQSVLTTKINNYLPFGIECKDLVTSSKGLQNLIEQSDNPVLLSRLVQTVALDWAQEQETGKRYLIVSYWDLASNSIKKCKLHLDPTVTYEKIARWISKFKQTQFSASFSEPACWRWAYTYKNVNYQLSEEGITVASLKRLSIKGDLFKNNIIYYHRLLNSKGIAEVKRGKWNYRIDHKSNKFEITLKLNNSNHITYSKTIEETENLSNEIDSILESAKSNFDTNKNYLNSFILEGSKKVFFQCRKSYKIKVTEVEQFYKLQLLCEKTGYCTPIRTISLISCLEKEINTYISELIPELKYLQEFLAEPEEFEEKELLSRSVLKVDLSRYLENEEVGLLVRYYDIIKDEFITQKRLLTSFAQDNVEEEVKTWINNLLTTNQEELKKLKQSIEENIDSQTPIEVTFGQKSLIANVQSVSGIGNGKVTIKFKVNGHTKESIAKLSVNLKLHEQNQKFLKSIERSSVNRPTRCYMNIGNYHLSVTVKQSAVYEVKIQKISYINNQIKLFDICVVDASMSKDLQKFCMAQLNKYLPFGYACKDLISRKDQFIIDWTRVQGSIKIVVSYLNRETNINEKESLELTSKTTESDVIKWIQLLKEKNKPTIQQKTTESLH